MAFNNMDALEIAKSAAIRRESSKLIKQKACERLYKDMYKLINDETQQIKDRIVKQMVFNKDNGNKNHKYNKIVFFSGKTYAIDDYVKLFEHCNENDLDDPLIDQLRRKFPVYKVYSKVKREYNKYDEAFDVYYIYIKWKKNQAL